MIAHDHLADALQVATRAEQRAATATRIMTTKYYLVLSAPNTAPLAMFQDRQWAEDWKAKYCATATIEEFDLKMRF